MESNNTCSRRTLVKSSAFGLLAVALPNVLFARKFSATNEVSAQDSPLFHRYPSIDDALVAEIVGASHFNFDRVKELVEHRPELARATWDWAFGDWETALGAASHVGRRDIAQLLIRHGARPDLFTFAMFGQYEVIKAAIEASPGIEAMEGPHGISLLSHAQAGMRTDYGITLTEAELEASQQLITYLTGLGTADPKATNMELTAEAMTKYLGDYRYGEGETDGFTVKLNMRNQLSLGKLGKGGGSLYQKAPYVFTYNGTSSVEIRFAVENDRVLSLTVVEPDLTLKALKV